MIKVPGEGYSLTGDLVMLIKFEVQEWISEQKYYQSSGLYWDFCVFHMRKI